MKKGGRSEQPNNKNPLFMSFWGNSKRFPVQHATKHHSSKLALTDNWLKTSTRKCWATSRPVDLTHPLFSIWGKTQRNDCFPLVSFNTTQKGFPQEAIGLLQAFLTSGPWTFCRLNGAAIWLQTPCGRLGHTKDQPTAPCPFGSPPSRQPPAAGRLGESAFAAQRPAG